MMNLLLSVDAAKILMASGCFAIFFSCWIGVEMVLPKSQKRGSSIKVDMKLIGAAHIDWIMLGLMSCAAAGLILLFELTLPLLVILLMLFGAWVNPLPYVFKAFGINAFEFGGDLVQKAAVIIGGISSLSIIIAWSWIFLDLVSG